MTTATLAPISASAISRILKTAGIRKAPTTDTWGIGFIVTGYDVEVGVVYQDTNRQATDEALDRIVELINGREDKKYWAVKRNGKYGSMFVKVVIRQETEQSQMARLVEFVQAG